MIKILIDTNLILDFLLDALVTRDADFVTELVPLLSVNEFLKQVAENE